MVVMYIIGDIDRNMVVSGVVGMVVRSTVRINISDPVFFHVNAYSIMDDLIIVKEQEL